MEQALVMRRTGIKPRENRFLPELTVPVVLAIVLTVALIGLVAPDLAFADSSGALGEIKGMIDKIKGGIILLGIGIAVWGGIKIGTSLSNSSGAAGPELNEGLGRVAGGAVILMVVGIFGNMWDKSGIGA